MIVAVVHDTVAIAARNHRYSSLCRLPRFVTRAIFFILSPNEILFLSICTHAMSLMIFAFDRSTSVDEVVFLFFVSLRFGVFFFCSSFAQPTVTYSRMTLWTLMTLPCSIGWMHDQIKRQVTRSNCRRWRQRQRRWLSFSLSHSRTVDVQLQINQENKRIEIIFLKKKNRQNKNNM